MTVRVAAEGTTLEGEEFVNVFNFNDAFDADDNIQAAFDRVAAFYAAAAPAMSAQAKVVRLAGGRWEAATGKAPTQEERAVNIPGTASGVFLPPQISLAITWQGEIPGRGSRGRTYMPLLAAAANTNGRPSLSVRQTLASAARTLLTSAPTTVSLPFVIVRRQPFRAMRVINAYVDNVFDTQRRRGELPVTEKTPLPA